MAMTTTTTPRRLPVRSSSRCSGVRSAPDCSSRPAIRPISVRAPVAVTTAAELSTALAGAQPGDVITLADGVYAGSFTLNASGTAADPIVIRGERRDGAILDGQGCGGCNGCGACPPQMITRCVRVWVPNVVREQHTRTVMVPQTVNQPYEYTVTVCRPERRTRDVQVCERVAEQVTREVPVTTCVPEKRQRTFQVTKYRDVVETKKVPYTVSVPYTVEREVQVPVCRVVPKVSRSVPVTGSVPTAARAKPVIIAMMVLNGGSLLMPTKAQKVSR